MRVGFAAGLMMVATTAMTGWPVGAQDAASPVSGAELYQSRCLPCHQADGVGAPGLAPPLAGTLGGYLGVEGGRGYLPQVLVSGLSGPIRSQGQPYNSVMPSFAKILGDEEIARVLNHVLGEFNREGLPAAHKPFEPADIAAARAGVIEPRAVRALREKLLAQVR